MKKILYLLCMGFALVACSEEELTTDPGEGVQMLFSAGLDVRTRASDDVYTPSRYIMEVYVGQTAAGNPAERLEQATGEFKVTLKKGEAYTCLFWADNGTPNAAGNQYNAADLKAVSTADHTKNPDKPAYSGMKQVTPSSSVKVFSVLLTHAVAKVSYFQTQDFPVDNNTLKITFPVSYLFNVATGEVAEIADMATTHIFTGIAKASANKVISQSYLLAPKAAVQRSVTARFNDEPDRTIQGVTLQANYNTNIKGNWSGSGPVPTAADMKFTIDLSYSGGDLSYIMPFIERGTTGNYTLTIDWGDGNTIVISPNTRYVVSDLTHTYTAAKEYQITITSTQTNSTQVQIPVFGPGNYNKISNNEQKIKSMDSPMLNTGSKFMTYCFWNCNNLTKIPADLFVNNPSLTSFSNCFRGCSNLTEIPANLFANNPAAEDFQNCFQYCDKLIEIPANLFANNPAVTDFSSCFYGCKNLTQIPVDLFVYNPAVTDFSSCFSSCSNLTKIPADLFVKKPAVTDFGSCFYGCKNLTQIPVDLFVYNPAVTDFGSCFQYCDNLIEIPANLFASNRAVTDFSSCFYGCSNLTKIPADLFVKNPAVTGFRACFRYCSKLTDLPADLFANNPAVTNFSECFSDGGLTQIPSGLFANNPAVTDFSNCFYYCGSLTQIPADLFANNPVVANFRYCFACCSSLTEIPASLFFNNPTVTKFEYCFYSCHNLAKIPVGLFANNPVATNFSYCFSYCTNIVLNADIFCKEADDKNIRFKNQSVDFKNCFEKCGSKIDNGGTVPALWSYDYGSGTPANKGCFSDVNHVTNFSAIPNEWK